MLCVRVRGKSVCVCVVCVCVKENKLFADGSHPFVVGLVLCLFGTEGDIMARIRSCWEHPTSTHTQRERERERERERDTGERERRGTAPCKQYYARGAAALSCTRTRQRERKGQHPWRGTRMYMGIRKSREQKQKKKRNTEIVDEREKPL